MSSPAFLLDTPGGVESVDLGNRRWLLDHIQAHPGIHLRQLQRSSGLAIGTLVYHLTRMHREGVVAVRQLDRFKSYFAVGALDRRDKDYLYYMRRPMPRRILEELLSRRVVSFPVLVDHLPIGRSTVSSHLRRLVSAHIVRRTSSGRGQYRLANPRRLQRLLQVYGTTLDTAPLSVESLSKASLAPESTAWIWASQR